MEKMKTKKVSQVLQNNSSQGSTHSSSHGSNSNSSAENRPKCTLDGKEVDSIVKGLTFATLNIIDDSTGPRKPYQIEALKQITGSAEEADQNLPDLLKNSFDMSLDYRIDESGLSECGYPVGVQGYIAHNEKTIVLSYKLKKTVFQFLEEMDSTSTEWGVNSKKEVNKSTYSLLFEQLMSLCGTHLGGYLKPTVHTGFYQNFLATLPMLKKYINPLLAPDQPRRSLFVVGHSIGAGVATLAACYFLLEFDWHQLPHRLVSVTGGSPRSCSHQMKSLIDERRKNLGDSVRLFRVVQEDDIVPLMPSSTYGFQHVFPFVSIDEKGNITKQGDLSLAETTSDQTGGVNINGQPLARNQASERVKKERMSRSPRSLRSHTHGSYMEPFLRIKGVSTVAELRLKALAPFYTPSLMSASESTKQKIVHPATPRIKATAASKNTSSNIGTRNTGGWWKPKQRKPNGSNKSMKSVKSTKSVNKVNGSEQVKIIPSSTIKDTKNKQEPASGSAFSKTPVSEKRKPKKAFTGVKR